MNKKWELSENIEHSLMESLLLKEGEIIKKSPAKLVSFHKTSSGDFYVKRSRHASFIFRPQKYWFKDCPARWEWSVAQTAQSLGVAVVDHLAICEFWSAIGLQEDILITRAFNGKPLHLAANVDPYRVMEFVNSCHKKGMVHGDLHPANILIDSSSGELRLADLKGVRFEENPDQEKQKEDVAYLNIHFPMPLSADLLHLSNRIRSKKMAVRYRRCLKENREFGPQIHGCSKWWVRKPMINNELNKILTTPDEVLGGKSLLKAGRTSTVGHCNNLVVKRYNFKKPLNLIKDLFRPTKARRAFQLGYHLELVGISTPRVVAVAEHRSLGFALRSYLVMEKIAEAKDLADMNYDMPNLTRSLAKLIGKMHAEGFVHRDLKASNILIDPYGKPYLIDLDGLTYSRQVSARMAVSNLKRLERGLIGKPLFTKLNWISFLRVYCRESGFCLSDLRV